MDGAQKSDIICTLCAKGPGKIMKNVVLIGMPGAGKSTIGVILAKVLGYHFLDTDILIQEQEGCLLKDIISSKGLDGFLEVEGRVNSRIEKSNTVIATGGSVVYSKEAMEHLQSIGVVIYLKLSYDTIESRLGNIEKRGVVVKEGQTLLSLYQERCPLYEQYAHICIDGEGKRLEELMEFVANCYTRYTNNEL